MAFKHEMQSSRFELKYLIDETKAEAIKSFIQGFLIHDEFVRPDQPIGYEVRSLYLDSSKLALSQATMEGHKNRFKLRIRFYDDKDASPAFLEIKRRNTDVITKQRAMVDRESVKKILAGAPPENSFLLKPSTKTREALWNFCQLRDQIRALGSVFVCYRRDAYVHPTSNSVRLTFDRNLTARAYRPGMGLTMDTTPTPTAVKGVTLELKFTDRFPEWMRDLVHSFDLVRRSVPKYCECVTAKGMTKLDEEAIIKGA